MCACARVRACVCARACVYVRVLVQAAPSCRIIIVSIILLSLIMATTPIWSNSQVHSAKVNNHIHIFQLHCMCCGSAILNLIAFYTFIQTWCQCPDLALVLNRNLDTIQLAASICIAPSRGVSDGQCLTNVDTLAWQDKV